MATTTATPTRADRPHSPSVVPSSVRRFITAFLAYEVGAGDPATKTTIRGDASQAFGRRLLSQSPMPDRPRPGLARITSLHVDPVPGHPELDLASGDARRPEGVEPFSFLFARHGDHWLAVAPGE